MAPVHDIILRKDVNRLLRAMPGAAGDRRASEVEECRRLVERIVASPLFERSARLREFLSYVAGRALDDPASKINEDEIARAVFARPLDSEGGDSIVRVHASLLRKRLEQFFSGEGSREAWIIEIPKGNYAPQFRLRRATADQKLLPPAPPGTAAVQRGRRLWPLAGLTAALAVVCVFLGVQNYYLIAPSPAIPRNSPTVSRFWATFFSRDRAADLVLSDSSLSLFADLIHRPLSLAEYVSKDYAQIAEPLAANPQLHEAAIMLMQRQNTPIGDANLARKLSLIGTTGPRPFQVFYARDFHIRHFKFDNVILAGARRANPWVELIEGHLDFRFGYNEAERIAFIEDRAPAGNGPAVYSVKRLSRTSRLGYAVIAFLPNPSGDGNVLYFAGSEMEGTEACSEFLTSEHWMSRLAQRTGPKNGNAFPYFQLLLKTDVVAGAAPEVGILHCRPVKL